MDIDKIETLICKTRSDFLRGKKYRRFLLMALLTISILTLILTGCVQPKKDPTNDNAKKKTDIPLNTAQIKRNVKADKITVRQDQQATLDQEYRRAAKDEKYTLDAPFVKQNPYKTSPLTALVIFHTTTPAQITYTVAGKDPQISITNTVHGGSSTVHQVPIVGLYPNYENHVTIRVRYEDGTSVTKVLTLKTGEMPANLRLAKVSVKNKDTAQMNFSTNKLNLMNRTTQEPFALDSNGEVRWYSTLYNQHVFSPWSRGHIMMLTKKNNQAQVYNSLIETDVLGRVYNEYQFDPKNKRTLIHHDIEELPNHNILATVSDGSVYGEDTLAEISHKTGKVVKVIDMKRVLPKSMWTSYKANKKAVSDGSATPKYDWLHMNSVRYLPKEKAVLLSNRNQDLTLKMDYQTSQIKWLYSGKKKADWPKKYRPFVLTPAKGTKITGGQHGLTELENESNDPNLENVLLYDNNTAVTNGDRQNSKRYSNAVQYQIDQKNKTIKQVWAYGRQLGQSNFTNIIGYAQRLENGNTLITFGHKHDGKESNIIEVKPDGTQVSNVTFQHYGQKGYVYRAYQIPFYAADYKFDVKSK